MRLTALLLLLASVRCTPDDAGGGAGGGGSPQDNGGGAGGGSTSGSGGGHAGGGSAGGGSAGGGSAGAGGGSASTDGGTGLGSGPFTATCVASGAFDTCAVPGWIFNNNRWNGTVDGSLTVRSGPTNLEFISAFNLNGMCCNGPYAGIGTIAGSWNSSQYNTGGSTLPLQLGQIATLRGAWGVQVPTPITNSQKYRVYYEMFLSSSTGGQRNAGNITIDFFYNQYSYYGTITHANIAGYNQVEIVDYGANPNGQGPFVAFVLPTSAYVPDSTGNFAVDVVDVKAFLDYAVAHFPNYYATTAYLSELDLAEEVMTLTGSFTTTFASFQIQKTGASTVYTPTWSAPYWIGR